MDAQNLLTIYADLQKILLNTRDTSKLLPNLINHAFFKLSQIDMHPLYMGGLFINENKQIMDSYIKDAYSSINVAENTRDPDSTYYKVNVMLNNTNSAQKLNSGKLVLVDDIQAILPKNLTDGDKIKCVILSPIIIENSLKGLLIIGIDKSTLLPEEEAFIQIMTNLAGSAYKLQDNQNTLTNITQELYKTNAQLRQLDKMKDQLIAVTSHELRTPATIVQNYLWMMLYKSDERTILGEKDKERLEHSYMSIQNLIHLISDILDVSKIESNRLELNFSQVDYEGTINDIIRAQMPKITAKNLTIVLNKAPDVPDKIYTDIMRLHEIFSNLISNAVKFTEKGGVVINVKRKDNNLIFEIKDTGRGISPEFLPNLFKKFYREDISYTASNPETGGTGLGLYIVKSIIELMHGSITVQSELGRGTTFIITLPAAPVNSPLLDTSALKSLTSTGVIHREDYLKKMSERPSTTEVVITDKKKTILLVEDDPDMQHLYSEFLTDDFNIVLAENGLTAFEKMEKEQFDVILLDIMMPKMDGIKFLEKRKGNKHLLNVPVIILTNLGSEDVLKQCMELGATATIMKSDVTPDQIPPIINRTLAK